MRPDDAGERVAIGDSDPGDAEFGGARDKLFWMRSPAQKRKIRRRRQLGETRRDADHRPSPLTGEGGAKRRGRMLRIRLGMRGRRVSALSPCASRRDPSPLTPLPQGEREIAAGCLTMAHRNGLEWCRSHWRVRAEPHGSRIVRWRNLAIEAKRHA